MSKNIYYHNHHIIPRHIGGTDDESNLIKLTIKEHAEAHRILYEKHGRWQDKLAWNTLSGRINKEKAIRIAASKARKNQVPWNKGLTKDDPRVRKNTEHMRSNNPMKNPNTIAKVHSTSLKNGYHASKERKQREMEYYKNPKLCEQCNKPLEYAKPSALKKRRFCNKSCAASWFNTNKRSYSKK